ncbi:MAG TPA: hypothetical protein DCX60_02645 [Phycisphaerales bacterium]|nr:hypothetical protein [Phycisphaerales bacterium]
MLAFCTKNLLRWGLITATVVGGTTLLIGPERVAAGFDQIRTLASSTFDELVDDPIALRRQLKGLSDQYPERIAEVRSELASIDVQIRQLEHDQQIAQRVVTITSKDINQLKDSVLAATTGVENTRKVTVRRGSFDIGLDQARSEARRIIGIKNAYEDRFLGNQQQISILNRQKERLTDILAKLESEFGEFEAKLFQLDRQIDSIERNERLIAMTEEQQAMLNDFEKLGKVGNLRQLEAKLEELRTTQEAQLQTLESHGIQSEYEQRAREEIVIDSSISSISRTDPDLAWLDG